MEKAAILVAARPQVEDTAREALAALGLPLEFCFTLTDACERLQSHRYRLLLGTLQFDDSRLFDLLSSARASGTPLVATRLSASQLPDSVIDAFFRAAQLLGFHGWIDFYRLSERHGRAEALRQLHELLRATALPIPAA